MRITVCNLKIERCNGNFYIGNYHLRFIADGYDKILKLPISSNERGLICNITMILATLLLPFTNGITIDYVFVLLNQHCSFGLLMPG
jgi:hypothetical protein